ncbi:MAG: hypothetical protein JZU59_00450 [Chromatium okenii]|nr:hypothetical protein [Chromatium okenii]
MPSRFFQYGIFALALWVIGAPAVFAAPDCQQSPQTHIWTFPQQPQPGAPLEVLAVATDTAIDQLTMIDPGGEQMPLRSIASAGPPWSRHATLFRPSAGIYRLEALRGGQTVACAEVDVGGVASLPDRGEWDLATEALYSVWIERLFDAPPEQALSFNSLAPLLRDPERNLLFNALGADEERRLPAAPDCADLPYFLRSYFAWKMGLPVGYRACNRGSRNRPPSCEAQTIDNRFVGDAAPLSSFRELSRRIMDTVHSGSGRTSLTDDATDFYPVALERASLWPGTLYADPYGHTLMLVKWIAPSAGRSGLLLAVDAQPDNSVTRKRFWEGTFLFAHTPSSGPGFKAFRPLLRTASGELRAVTNAALDGANGRPAFSTEQNELAPADFYARMEQLINPNGLTPELAYQTKLAALMEQLETRLTSVDNGEVYMRDHPSAEVAMPSGAAIFETIGAWEDYATPSRDMRLLIAMNVVEGLPEQIRRYPQLYQLRGTTPERAAAALEQLHNQYLDERFISYSRSDGSPWRLSLRELYARRLNLEIAYNPNDCIERRWGAEAGSADVATCTRRAPPEQRAKMEEYRPWFHNTTRPPR